MERADPAIRNDLVAVAEELARPPGDVEATERVVSEAFERLSRRGAEVAPIAEAELEATSPTDVTRSVLWLMVLERLPPAHAVPVFVRLATKPIPPASGPEDPVLEGSLLRRTTSLRALGRFAEAGDASATEQLVRIALREEGSTQQLAVEGALASPQNRRRIRKRLLEALPADRHHVVYGVSR